MDAKTLEALKGSIKKWEKIVGGTEIDNGRLNCPLCELFEDKRCLGCPVFEQTAVSGCDGTPYEKWINHQEYRHFENSGVWMVYCPTCKELAQKELDFLRSLLPKRKRC